MHSDSTRPLESMPYLHKKIKCGSSGNISSLRISLELKIIVKREKISPKSLL